jgi:hypothetical protein
LCGVKRVVLSDEKQNGAIYGAILRKDQGFILIDQNAFF